jgi:hypothetical protein
MSGVVFAASSGWQDSPASDCGLTFDTQKCAALNQAIDELEASPLDLCRWMGTRARGRLEAGNYRYDPHYALYGYMQKGLPTVTLGPMSFAPIGTGHLSQYLQVQNTVAHEEAHFVFGLGHSFDRNPYIRSYLGAPDEIGEACRAGRFSR